MSVPQEVLEHKTLMIAMLASANEVAGELGLDANMPVAAMARCLAVNRTSVYEQKERLVRALGDLAAARPGRPAAEDGGAGNGSDAAAALWVRVLEFRLERPDAVVKHASRTTYSPSFRRFILGELDRWPGTMAAFAQNCRLPLDTLKDWVQGDRAGIAEPVAAKPRLVVPVDAAEVTGSIVSDFQAWEGSTRDFQGVTARRYGLNAKQVARVLRICAATAARRKPSCRYRGTTWRLSPGALLVTDGKTLDVELTGSGTRVTRNWQGIVDQATGCDTAVVISRDESAEAARRAFAESVTFLGDVPPHGLLHDNKPCYEEARFRDAVAAKDTLLIAATPGRAENKAILEGSYGLFESRVGRIRLDDSTTDSLVDSAVAEIVRAYTAATNGVPRAQLNGQSREAALRAARPSCEQQAADRAFVRNLKDRHDRSRLYDWRRKIKPMSRQLLGHVFAALKLESNDPLGKLQEYLSVYDPAAIRRAAAIVAVRLERGDLQTDYAHRYLAKVIQGQQDSLDLERSEELLLELGRQSAQDWVSAEREEYQELRRQCDPPALACALAERAALGGLPVSGAYWTERLLELLAGAEHLREDVRRFLVRLYEAPAERRLALLDRLIAEQWGIA